MQKIFGAKEIFVIVFILLFAFVSIFVEDSSEINLSPRENFYGSDFDSLTAERSEFVEENGREFSVEGELLTLIAEDFNGWSEIHNFIYDKKENEIYRVYFEEGTDVSQTSGKFVRIDGKMFSNKKRSGGGEEKIEEIPTEIVEEEIVNEEDIFEGEKEPVIPEVDDKNKKNSETSDEKFAEIENSEVFFTPPMDFSNEIGEISVSKIKSLDEADEILEDLPEENENFILGEKKVAVVLIKNSPALQYQQPSFFENLIFNGNDLYKVNNWILENSHGKTQLDGDVYGWYNIHQGEMCTFVFTPAFLNELISLGVPVQNYDYVHVIRPGNCYGLGYSTVGKVSYLTNSGEVNVGISMTSASDNLVTGSSIAYAGVITHELGHNFGLGHANRLHCYGDVLRDGCKDQEYGDFFSHMGQNFFQSYSSAHKILLGWIEENEILEVENSGEYILYPYESSSSGVKTLKISSSHDLNYLDGFNANTDGEIRNFYVEFRRPISYDNFFSGTGWWHQQNNFVAPSYQDGAYISLMIEGDARSHRLDLNPGFPSGTPWDPIYDGADVVLREGESADFSDYGFSLTTLEVTDEFLRVYVNFSLPECVESSSLELHYGFNNNLSDLSGNSRNGNPYGFVNYSNDVPNILNAGKSLEFRPWFYIQSLNSQNILPAENSSSICYWAKYSSNNFINDARIVSKGITSSVHVAKVGVESFVKKSSTNLRFGSSSNFAEFIYPSNQWHFVCNVYQPSSSQKMKIFVDGNLVAYQNVSDVQTTSELLTLGALTMNGNLILTNGQPHFFRGKIDELTIWNGALTGQEINRLYENYIGENECLS